MTLGLEIYKFETSRMNTRHRERVKADYEGGVKGTPTFFVNGRKYVGKREVEGILRACEEAGIANTGPST